jgi:glycosyltransferase involved in cell wall biosynthesis
MAGRPLFSIVIPTRSRAGTLRHTLETCAGVDFDDFEVVIGDNASTDDTAEIAHEFVVRDPRFRHCRSSHPLSAAANFERLLDHARGQYLIYIGDDDGLHRHSLRLLAGLIDRYQPEALGWLPESFVWPGSGRTVSALFALDSFTGVLEEPRDLIFTKINDVHRIQHFSLTGFDLYHGCIARSAIDRTRERYGKLFAGPIPDVAASYLLMEAIETSILTGLPATVAGISSASIGQAFTTPEPTAAQIEIRNGFRADIKASFPTSDPLFDGFTLLSPYLATFADYLRKIDGSLARLNTAAWADAMLNQIALEPPPDRASLLAIVNDFFKRAAAEGAEPTAEITLSALDARREAGSTRAYHPSTPYRFDPAFLEASLGTMPYAGRDRPGGIVYEFFDGDTVLFIDARTSKPAFTIEEFVILRQHILGLAQPDYVSAYLDDEQATWDAYINGLARDVAQDLILSVASR